MLPPSGQLLPIRFGGPAKRLIDTGCLEVKTQFQLEYGDVHWINRRCDSPVKEHTMSRRFAHKHPRSVDLFPTTNTAVWSASFSFPLTSRSAAVKIRAATST